MLDGSVGRAGAVANVGGVYAITPDLGQTRGPNLFHSFSRFDLAAGETASFSGPASIQNVLARVTGGSSAIDGTIQCTIPGANFYLINPAGVVFGPNARLDVKGSFAVTTADALNLADGGSFRASNPGASVLTSAAPAAFGFVAPRPAAIQVRSASLAVGPGAVVSIIGGDVSIGPAARVQTAGGGAANLVGVAGPGTVTLDASRAASVPTVSAGTPAGGVVIAGGSSLAALAIGTPVGGTINVVAGDLTLAGGSTLDASAAGTAHAGVISISASRSVAIVGGSGATVAGPAGIGGDLTVTAGQSIEMAGGFLSANGLKTGSVVVAAPSVALAGGSAVSTDTFQEPDVPSELLVNASLLRIDASAISAQTTGPGDAGMLAIGPLTPGGRLDVIAAHDATVTAATASSGDGGRVTLTASNLLTSSAHILASSFGSGEAGSVTLNLGVLRQSGGNVASSATAGGKGGSVSVSARRILLTGGALVSARSTQGGSAGAVSVRADRSLDLRDGASLSGEAQAGRGGNLTAFAPVIRLHDASVVATADQTGGDVRLTAGRLIELSHSRISTRTGAGGGSIRIDPPALVLDSSQLTAFAADPAGGNILIQTDSLLSSGATLIRASGTFVSTAPQVDLTGSLTPLPANLSSETLTLAPQCGARTGEFSSFIVTPRGGTPPRPGGFIVGDQWR